MWPFRQRRTDPRNVLFDAALEFGANWRRDVAMLAAERLPQVNDDDRATFAQEIEVARREIEEWILNRWLAVDGQWSRAHSDDARAFITETFPWIDDRNTKRAINQGTYYAWHG